MIPTKKWVLLSQLKIGKHRAAEKIGYKTNSTSNSNWWLRSPYYTYYNISFLSEAKSLQAPPKSVPPKREIHQMSDEEFDTAFNDLLFGNE